MIRILYFFMGGLTALFGFVKAMKIWGERGGHEVFTEGVGVVSRATDGDTIYVEIDGEDLKVRLIGVDTPETVHPVKGVEFFGREACDVIRARLEGETVRLVADRSQGDLDKYNRLLRYVFLEDGTNFNKWLVENGYAFEYTYGRAYKYQSAFRAAEDRARAATLGLWSDAEYMNYLAGEAAELMGRIMFDSSGRNL